VRDGKEATANQEARQAFCTEAFCTEACRTETFCTETCRTETSWSAKRV
jgi:hypothetical protein